MLKQVFLTEEENKKLNDCMRKENIRNFSEFARQKLIRTDLNIQKVSFEGLVPLTEELEQVGKNINSIARLATVVGRISYENKMDMSILMQWRKKMFIFKSNMDKDFDQICEYILKLKRAELFLHGIKQQDKTKARLYHAMLEYYDANHKKERHMRILK